MLKILIADDHAIVRRGLRNLLQEAFPAAEITEATDAEELVQKAMLQTWSVVITDLAMPGRSGLESIQQLKQLHPRMPVLVLSMYPEEQYAIRVLRSGASGYLNKESAPDELVNAVHRVLAGKKYITASIAEKMASSLGQDTDKPLHEQLSDREFEVLKLLAAGKAVSDIAQMFHLSVTTISTYRSRILTKMNMKSNADLTQYAIANGLI
ncbi:response regulator [Aridibaculum aurantiacum]|uniref:response regulator n=1 Tax=Aridibaculum aurantiacum TaxID=2810307 RepID=UPI001F6030A7|nr:response regulator transcription factor [Aridibaculum aurantiacum]